MCCKCNWVEAILAIVIIVFAYIGSMSSRWIIIIAALLLLIHALLCRQCQMCEGQVKESKTFKKKRK